MSMSRNWLEHRLNPDELHELLVAHAEVVRCDEYGAVIKCKSGRLGEAKEIMSKLGFTLNEETQAWAGQGTNSRDIGYPVYTLVYDAPSVFQQLANIEEDE